MAGDGISCEPCRITATIPATSFGANPPLYSERITLFGYAVDVSPNEYACTAGGYAVNWQTGVFDNGRYTFTPGLFAAKGLVLSIPPRSLPVGTVTAVAMTVCFADNSRLESCGTATMNIATQTSDIVAHLSGGNTVTQPLATVTLAASTDDPDNNPGAFQYTWGCTGPSAQEGRCIAPSGDALVFENSPTQLVSLLFPGQYGFEVNVSKDDRQKPLVTSLTVIEGEIVPISIQLVNSQVPNEVS